MPEVKQNRFCVPFALAFIAGLTPNDAAAALKTWLVSRAKQNAKRYTRESRQHADNGDARMAIVYKNYAANAAARAQSNARKPIKGVQCGIYTNPDFLATLGLKVAASVGRPGMTIKSWCAVRVKWADKGTWIVCNSSHALVFVDGIIYDNGHKTGVPFADYEYTTTRVENATLLERLDGTKFIN